jgi:outer membrane protein OmpA-like peptidoglycan-associated protein
MSLSKLLVPHSRVGQKEDHWIPLSDLMTGLMIMFMLIAVVFMIQVQSESEKVKNIAVLYDTMREQLYTDLKAEFSKDLPQWDATLDRDLTIRFQEPDVLFDTGKSILKPRFVQILDDFFPRYVKIIAGPKYKASIEEIRIEGHTSSQWAAWSPADLAYFRNMELSQSRTRSALEHVLLLTQVADQKTWLTARLTANGLSSSHLRLNPDGSENREASQRVEFRVRTNAEARIGEILKAAVE